MPASFKDILNQYIDALGCTASQLSRYSGISGATISRYRSGERIPSPDSQHFELLCQAISQLAVENGQSDLTFQKIADSFSTAADMNPQLENRFSRNFHALLSSLSISVSDLARALNYDSSYISRIRNGQRTPSDPRLFAEGTAHFVVKRYPEASHRTMVARLTGCDPQELMDDTAYFEVLSQWLIQGENKEKDDLSDFLRKLDEFDLNEYIRVIHFDKMKVPSVPFQFPISKSYYGLSEMMDSELAFLKTTVLSKSMEAVTMYSDMPMEEMAKDPDFPKKWMFGMAVMLKKGLHLNQIHCLNRSFTDMMLGLESWIPMYMTGQISPYYLKTPANLTFSHLLKVSGSAALSGEAITGFHENGRYYLTNNKEEVAYYKKRAEHLLSKALPLMEIYGKDSRSLYHAFLHSDIASGGSRYGILSSLPLYTADEALLCQIMDHNQVTPEERTQILSHAREQLEMALQILSRDTITEEMPLLTEEEFHRSPMRLSLSGIFCEKDIFYSWDDYQKHLLLLEGFQECHPNYTCRLTSETAFSNIQIQIHKGSWVMVSKNKAPAMHFLIRHPKMLHAFENMVIPISDTAQTPDKASAAPAADHTDPEDWK